MSDEEDTEDLDALAEHVDHLQNRINRLWHFYGGSHDQKTHGKRGAGTGKKGGLSGSVTPRSKGVISGIFLGKQFKGSSMNTPQKEERIRSILRGASSAQLKRIIANHTKTKKNPTSAHLLAFADQISKARKKLPRPTGRTTRRGSIASAVAGIGKGLGRIVRGRRN